MKLSTPVPVKQQDPKLDHHSRIFLMGSCFVENIGERLDYYKFQNLRNPFGILFHPLAQENFLLTAIEGYIYAEGDVFFHNERWHSFAAHSYLSDPIKDRLINNLNEKSRKTVDFLKNATHVIITLGTSFIYRNQRTDKPVANCHKLPQKNFSKELTSIIDIERSLNAIITSIISINTDIKIIFTISPVRHLKDGVVENQQSKAHLISALHAVLKTGKHSLAYFPSYEIMMDELRDYRYYTEDMVHPNNTAIQYIWNKFTAVWCTENTSKTLKEIEQIQRSLTHRPFNQSSRAHQIFIEELNKKIDNITIKFPHIQLDKI